MKINWKVRFKNKAFWLTLIPTLILLIQAVASVFGFDIEFGDLNNKLIYVVELVFVLLAILGIVTDPTTTGVSDSEQALTYTTPKSK
jgi:phi LC3 family holin